MQKQSLKIRSKHKCEVAKWVGGNITIMSPPEIIHSLPVTLKTDGAAVKGMGLKRGDNKSHISVQRETGETSCSV